MGYWGVGNFENDDAMDWVNEFMTAPSVTRIVKALSDYESYQKDLLSGRKQIRKYSRSEIEQFIAEGVPLMGFTSAEEESRWIAQELADYETGAYERLQYGPVWPAISAAETVAAMRGHPSADMPEELKRWVLRRKRPPSLDVTALAERVVSLVQSNELFLSHLQRSVNVEAWVSGVKNLQARLVS